MPLEIKPSYRSIINFLGNYSIAQKLLREYLDKGVKFDFSDIYHLILEDINDAHSHHLSNESSVAFLDNKIGGNPKSHPFFNLLMFLAKEHFEFIRGRNILKIENIETFQFLHNTIDINPIYAMAISMSIKDISHTQRVSYIKLKTDNNSIEFPKRFSFLESFSDNHFHLGGANSFAYRFHTLMQYPLSLDTSMMPQDKNLKVLKREIRFQVIAYATSLLEKIMFSYVLRNNKAHINHKSINYTALFQKQFIQLADGVLNNNLHTLGQIERMEGLVAKSEGEDDIKQEDIPALFSIRPISRSQDISFYIKDNYYNTLIFKIVKNNQLQNIQKADKILWILLTEILRSHPNSILKDAIYIYTSFRNTLHKLIIQQQKQGGLQYFSSYSRSSARRAKKKHEFVDSFRSILSSSYRMNIEGRINFQDTTDGYATEMTKWLSAFIEVKDENKGKCDYEDSISFIFHFQKKEEKNFRPKRERRREKTFLIESRYERFRRDLFIKTRAFLDFLKSSKYTKVPIVTNTKDFYENEETQFDITKKFKKIRVEKNLLDYISGIDAASREDKVPPEVFAPIYRYIRNSLELSMLPFEHNIPRPNLKVCRNKIFQFSYHVGEEFRDINTGIRHIFEAIIFLGFRKGDRLGHALALGMSPKDYLSNHKVVITSKEEQFDNAIFSYFILDSFSNDGKLKYDFYQKAMNLGSDIYRGDYTIDNYINAWLLRRNSPTSLKRFLDSYIEYSTDDKYSSLKNQKNSTIYEIQGHICALASQSQTKEDHGYLNEENFLLTFQRVMHQDKLYFNMSLPDIYNPESISEDKVLNRYAWACKDPKAWELFLRYSFEKKVYNRGDVKIDTRSINSISLEIIQDIIMEELVSQKDIVIEVMPTSNILNSDLYSYKHHPLFRFNPVDDIDEFNPHKIRKTKLRIIINTDNPGFQSTSYINELFLILQAGLQRGYSTGQMEEYLKEIIELGNLIYSGKASQE